MTYLKYYEIGEQSYINGNYSEALNFFKQSLSQKETNECLNYIGCCYLRMGNFDFAINTF